LVVNSVDSLYYYILPFLDDSKMYTRKAIDFKLWRVALLLHKLGYYYLPEGRQLITDISNTINKKRYSTTDNVLNDVVSIDDIFKRSAEIFYKNPPFDINLGKSHVELAQSFNKIKRGLYPAIVYIYKNNKLVKGSPFTTYSSAHKALGLNSSSNTCNRYIDTNKLYKNEYLITSRPLGESPEK